MITADDIAVIVERCRVVPRSKQRYVADDFVTCLLETVIDFQQRTTTVERAMEYYKSNCWAELRTIAELKKRLSRHPDTKAGNTALAQSL